ncbi:MAG TPA: UbiD family decarboxylase, partial [Thermoguttaceae bacterium]|nr:UbiD family decarboxylase [Thermoguttaceae bacterium]
PEAMSELGFAGVLGRRRVAMIVGREPLPIAAEADFCICGYLDPERRLPEGPFGDHLGYYSLAHEFPVLRVERVYHRDGAIWPFTVVGRPPQEDSIFAELIHELTAPAVSGTIPGVRAVHAVEAAGVHPLLLALGSDRYLPQEPRRPRELLTQANAILGRGQLSLAKYLWIAAVEDGPSLDVRRVEAFLLHVLSRIDWRRDVHFQTQTTIDTLDYSGTGLCEGSKVVFAAAGPVVRELPTELPLDLTPGCLAYGVGCLGQSAAVAQPNQSSPMTDPRVAHPGILVVRGSAYQTDPQAVARWAASLDRHNPINRFPLVVVVDDAEFAARSLDNLLWVTFTRSNPAADVHGIESFVEQKHWGCQGSLVIDARAKPHHAPPLVEDPEITRRVDELASPGGPLHGII